MSEALPGPHARKLIWRHGKVVLITLAMGSLEVNSPRMLGVFALTCALNIACHLYVTYGGLAGALAVFIFLDPCRAHANPRTPRDDNDERQDIT